MSSVHDDFLDAVAIELAKKCLVAAQGSGIGCIGCALSEYCAGEDSPKAWRDTIGLYLDGWSGEDTDEE